MASPDSLLSLRLGREDPVRLPDEFSQATAATVLRSEYNITSDAAGNAVWAENNNLTAARTFWTVTAGSVATGSGIAHPQLTAFTAAARLARLVHTRVQVVWIGAEQTTSGYLSVAPKTTTGDIDNFTVDGLHTGSSLQVRVTDGAVIDITYTQTPRWEDPSIAGFMLGTFPLVLFCASGMPVSANCFRVRDRKSVV